MSLISLPRTSSLISATTLPQSLAGRSALCLAASLLVALCAHVSFVMPFTPVPTTLQTFAVILVGMVLGPVEGFAALTLYLAEGASGLPVFSPHGPGGVLQLLGPTAGYLFAYPVAAALAGGAVRVLRHVVPAYGAALMAGVIGLVPVFLLGSAWLAHLLNLGGARVISLAVTPFLVPEFLKLLAAAAAFSALSMAQHRSRHI